MRLDQYVGTRSYYFSVLNTGIAYIVTRQTVSLLPGETIIKYLPPDHSSLFFLRAIFITEL